MKQIAKEIRTLTVECIASIGQGHIGGSLSIVDVLTVLYYKHMNIDPKNPKKLGRDRLVLSKGHAGPALYATLAHKGYFDKSELKTLNRLGTNLPSHCDMNKTPGVDMTAGSLGQGLSCACGMAIASKMDQDNAYIYCIIGDGEAQEGQIWEASMFASHRKLDNLIVFLDNNKLQLSGYTKDVMSIGNAVNKWESFGFYVQEIDGHDLEQIDKAIQNAKTNKEKPSMIVLNTIKGKGVKYAENAAPANHSMPLSEDNLKQILEELK